MLPGLKTGEVVVAPLGSSQKSLLRDRAGGLAHSGGQRAEAARGAAGYGMWDLGCVMRDAGCRMGDTG